MLKRRFGPGPINISQGETESRRAERQDGRQADGKVGHSSPSCVLKLLLGLMTDMSQKVPRLSETDVFLIVFSKENTEGSSSEQKPKNIQARRDVSFCLRARSVFGSPFKVSVRPSVAHGMAKVRWPSPPLRLVLVI